jgi:hypothetical protein
MKKTVRLLSLAVALFAGLSGNAQADGFKIGADVVSSYVWRGGELSNSPAIQPAVSYTFPSSGIIAGAWGTNAFSESSGSRYQETDLYVTVPVGAVTVTVTDYYVPITGNSKAFDFSSTGANTVELSAAYTKEELTLLAAINVTGNTFNTAKYFEAGYKIYDQDKYTAKAFVGAGNKSQYAIGYGDEFALVNLGVTLTKESYSASYVYNPASEKANFIFTASF